MIEAIIIFAVICLVFSPCYFLAKLAIIPIIEREERQERHEKATERHELYEMRKAARYIFDFMEGQAW